MNKNLKIILSIILAYVCFATVVISAFFAIINNPIDVAAMTYIWNNVEDLEAEYGEITHMGRYIKGKEKSENRISTLYGAEVKSGEIVIRVFLEKVDDEWVVQSMEVEEYKEKLQ